MMSAALTHQNVQDATKYLHFQCLYYKTVHSYIKVFLYPVILMAKQNTYKASRPSCLVCIVIPCPKINIHYALLYLLYTHTIELIEKYN